MYNNYCPTMLRRFSFPTTTTVMRMVFLLGLVMLHVTISNAMAVGRFRKAIDVGNQPPYNFTSNVGDFAAKLFREIAKATTGDFVCSPISAMTALSITAFGAKSSTRDQLWSALGIPNEVVFTEYLSMMRPLIQSLAIEERERVVSLAHKMFLANRFQLREDFVNGTRDIFLAESETVDFENVEAACTTINEWCSHRTNEHFNNLIKPDDIDNKTSVILVDVASFRGRWLLTFSPDGTKHREFWIHGNTSEYPLTMHTSGTYRYGELPEVDARFIELPYASYSDIVAMSMFVILPNARDGIDKLKNNLDKVAVDKRRNGTSGPVELYLPRFKIESSIDLAQPLNQLAVTEMFARTADFRGISDGRQLKISKIVQRVTIAVDEHGSEPRRGSTPPMSHNITVTTTVKSAVEFRVDHPFVILIETETGVVLFAAVVSSREGLQYHQPSCYDYCYLK